MIGGEEGRVWVGMEGEVAVGDVCLRCNGSNFKYR